MNLTTGTISTDPTNETDITNKKYVESAFTNNIDFDLLRKNCEKETAKTFIGINAKAIIDQIMSRYENIEISEKEIIQCRFEVLEYLDIIDKKYSGYCFVTDVDVEFSPKLKLYALANGNEIPVKIDRKIFAKKQVRRGDIIKVEDQYRKNKKKKVNGEWIDLEEKEWWISEYKIC